MGARASQLKEFARFNRRVRPLYDRPVTDPDRHAATILHSDWEGHLFYRLGRNPSAMGRKAQRRYARAVIRRISSGQMRPKDQQYAACLVALNHAAISLQHAFQDLTAVCARIDIRVLFAMQRKLTGDLAELESTPIPASG